VLVSLGELGISGCELLLGLGELGVASGELILGLGKLGVASGELMLGLGKLSLGCLGSFFELCAPVNPRQNQRQLSRDAVLIPHSQRSQFYAVVPLKWIVKQLRLICGVGLFLRHHGIIGTDTT
jgi:hypothetical protein